MASPLFTRWFQAQVFTPGFRMHRIADDAHAPWQGPAPSQKVLVDFILLRRRLEPYVASVDFGPVPKKKDAAARGAPATLNDYARAGDQIHPLAFGPDFWVQPAPATETPLLRITLPDGPAWIDFWTGARYPGGENIRTPAPLELIPAFVRAGAILPLAPGGADAAKPDAALEIRVYPGADGTFVLQDPAGPVAFAWNDQAGVLRIHRPAGFPARPTPARRLDIVVVRPGRGVGLPSPTRPDMEATFHGPELLLTLPPAPPRALEPKGFSAHIEGGHVVFGWQAPCSSAIYRLKRVLGPGGLFEDLASALQTTRFTLPLSACEAPFEYVVTAMNAGGESAPSAPARITPPAAAAGDRRPAPRALGAPPLAAPRPADTPALPTTRGLWAAPTPGPLAAQNPPARLPRAGIAATLPTAVPARAAHPLAQAS